MSLFCDIFKGYPAALDLYIIHLSFEHYEALPIIRWDISWAAELIKQAGEHPEQLKSILGHLRWFLKGAATAARPDCVEAYPALGLKIRFPGGQEAITVPTHAFITLRYIRSTPLLPIADRSGHIRMKLTRYSPIKSGLSM
ncbi:unnamed protein product [Penicillium salamii]|uniref:Uncharacterized protein n=1 Tax=Penicillium salamii TaxID=1612424 RepID=A0A9W4JAL1_9EURO|nr:unnamed protein product [Penicillium salamii]CAG8251517.1 unnamed protein product [Penicillium salamii]CAG8280179.1 unnamed protein product [Penicillium salamii]CAG8382180.1 unnamed protein product [Penicillium salamii]CAG8387043.1 unnamed protein product [Penicillium salamii]